MRVVVVVVVSGCLAGVFKCTDEVLVNRLFVCTEYVDSSMQKCRYACMLASSLLVYADNAAKSKASQRYPFSLNCTSILHFTVCARFCGQ